MDLIICGRAKKHILIISTIIFSIIDIFFLALLTWLWSRIIEKPQVGIIIGVSFFTIYTIGMLFLMNLYYLSSFQKIHVNNEKIIISSTYLSMLRRDKDIALENVKSLDFIKESTKLGNTTILRTKSDMKLEVTNHYVPKGGGDYLAFNLFDEYVIKRPYDKMINVKSFNRDELVDFLIRLRKRFPQIGFTQSLENYIIYCKNLNVPSI